VEHIGQASEVLGVREPALDAFDVDGEMPASGVRRTGARVLKKSTVRLQPEMTELRIEHPRDIVAIAWGRSDGVPDAPGPLIATPRTHDT